MTTANSPASKEVVTAALLVIGGKILSGRTKDQNIGYIAEYLTALGIDLKQVRVVGQDRAPLWHRSARSMPMEAGVGPADVRRGTDHRCGCAVRGYNGNAAPAADAMIKKIAHCAN